MIAVRVKDIQESQVVFIYSCEDVCFLLTCELDTIVSGNYQPFLIICQTHVFYRSTEEEFLREFEEVSRIIELEDVTFVRGISTGNEEVLVIVGNKVPDYPARINAESLMNGIVRTVVGVDVSVGAGLFT